MRTHRLPFRTLALTLGALAATAGCRIEKPATVVPSPPTVDSFTASTRDAEPGATVTLSWTTSNATSVELREASGGALPVATDLLSGSHPVTIEKPSLFLLTAKGPGGSDARVLSVNLAGSTVGEVTFSALPPVIPGGASTTLAWTAPGASSVSLSAGGMPIDIGGQRGSGAVTVSPKFDTTYTLDADGTMKTVDVTVQAALLTTTVTPRAAEVGDTITIEWTAAGADSVQVSASGRGQLFEATTRADIETGSFADTVPPTPDNGLVTYEIAAVKGTTRFTRTFEVNVGTGLAITRFDAPRFAAAGASYSLRWETRAADQVEVKLDGVTVHRTPSRQTAAAGLFSFVTPTSDFSLELVATNAQGARESQIALVDSVGVPSSATLTVMPAMVNVGQPVTLTFASAEARRARIVDSRGEVVFSVTGQAAESGTFTFYPDVTTTFTLSADNLLGNPAVTATADVTVTGAAPTVTQFPPTAISGQNVQLTTTTSSALLYGFPHSQVLSSTQADFRDISSTGARVLETSGEVTSVELPFATRLWGLQQTGPLTISRAGWIAWGAPLVALTSNASTIPTNSGPAGLIAPFWDDLVLTANSAVYVQVVDEAPNQSLIVQWHRVQVGTNASTELTFQVQVHQRGTISFQYQTMTLPSSPTFTIGVQDRTRQLGLRSTATPASNSALYFFSPVTAPAEARVARDAHWGGYLKDGELWAVVSEPAGAYVIPTDLSLTELMFRPHAAVPNGQYMEVLNRTGGPLDMTGWELRAPGVPTFVVPSGFVLQPSVPVVIGASDDPEENDNAGVTLAWGPSGFRLSEDAGSFTFGIADAGASFNYNGPADGGRGAALDVDPGPFVASSGTGPMTCTGTATFGSQTPPQLGSPGTAVGCGFGYELRTIPVHFVDISDGGTQLVNSPTSAVDGRTVPITLADAGTDPAPNAFGARRPVVSMSVDGWLVWGSSTTVDFSNSTVPVSSDAPAGKLAIFWDDLQTTPSVLPVSDLFWKYFAANEDPVTPAEHWVFQWAHVRHYSTSPADDLNFEIKLFVDGTIEYHYGTMISGTAENYADGRSAAIWLENTLGNRALFIGREQPVIRPNTAYRFIPR